jgi:hypothetical protein
MALAAGGCRERAKEQPAARAGGMKVKLPEGWSVRMATDDTLRVGSADNVILRIQFQQSQQTIPSPESLFQSFTKKLKGTTARLLSQKSSDDVSLVMMELTSTSSLAAEVVLLGVKKTAAGLLLCSTEPGTAPSDVQLAASACEMLSQRASDSPE